jgi:outer membrane protein assembly factor BamB
MMSNEQQTITGFMKIKKWICYPLAIISISLFFSSHAQEVNWTHFRGSNLNGISPETHIPVHWNDSSHVAWKTSIHGKGWSSPVVFGNQIWITTAEEDGSALYALCVDKNTGHILFDKKLNEPDTVYPKHSFNSYATPTPCIEDGFVYLHFGSYGTYCLRTTDAELVWERTDFSCEHVQGPGSSPVIYKDMLILHFEGTDKQYLVALNKSNGRIIWKTDRPVECYESLEPIGKKAYTTPLIIRVNGKDLLISNGSAVCIAYDPDTGAEIWRVVRGEDSTIAMPFFENGLVYFYTSFTTPPGGDKYAELLAVDPKGKGNIDETNIIWSYRAPILQLLTPVITGGLIYTIDTRSNMICLDALTGTKVWSEKVKGIFNASPVYADGNIYFSSTKGSTLVIREGRKPEVLAENSLKGEIWATPAIIENSLIIRTSGFLYRITE